MIVYLDSNHSKAIHPLNTAARFTVQMPEPFTSPKHSNTQGKWYLGLVDIVLPPLKNTGNKWDVTYVTCLQCEGAVVGDKYGNVLRSIANAEIKRRSFIRFSSVLHIPLRVTDVYELTVELRNHEGELLEVLNPAQDQNSTKCTLELIWRKGTSH